MWLANCLYILADALAGQCLDRALSEYLNNGFRALGFDIGHSETPIIPVMLGDEDLAVRALC